MKYSFGVGLQLVLLILVLIAVSYIFKLVRDKTQTTKDNVEGFESLIDPVVPNQLRYWGGRKKGIVQEYDGEKFLELDAQGDLKLTSRDETYKKYLGTGQNPNYHGPLKIGGEYVAVEGHNIGIINNIGLEACKNRCDGIDGCQGISYRKRDKRCALEKHSCANAPKDCVPSKWRAYEKLETNDKLIEADKVEADFGDAQHDITILGNNVAHIKSTTLKNCLNTCHKNPRCAAASFRRGECYHEGKTCKEAGKACVKGDKAKGWQMFELSNTSSRGGLKNRYYPVRIGGKRAAISGHNLKKLKAHSLDKCIAECDKAGSKCVGVEYEGKECRLSSAICRSVGSKCSNYKSVDAYEKLKHIGPFYIQNARSAEWSGSFYLGLSGNAASKKGKNGLRLKRNPSEYTKWYFHPDGSIQNVGNDKYINRHWSPSGWSLYAAPWKSHQWFWIRRNYTGAKGAGHIVPFWTKRKINYDLFMYAESYYKEVTLPKESKSGKRKNPNYTTCKTQSGKKSTRGSKYLYTGKDIQKNHFGALWFIRKA